LDLLKDYKKTHVLIKAVVQKLEYFPLKTR